MHGEEKNTNVLRKKRKSEKIKDGEKSKNQSRHLLFQTEKLARTSRTNPFCWNISIHSFLILHFDF